MDASKEVYVMREAIIKLTQLLSGKGIQVTQRGISAYVKADTSGRPYLVNLPFIPDNATSELIDAIQGFLDHEVAHILFTEFKTMGEVSGPDAGSMLNIIEDSRIEREMAKRFQGSAENLSRMGKFFLDKYTVPKMTEALAKGNLHQLEAVLTVPLIRAMAGQQIFKEFMRDKMDHVADLYDKIKDLETKIAGATSSRDCLALAETITKRLRDGAAAPAAPPSPPTGAPKSKPAKGKASKGGKPGDGAGKPDDAGEGAGGASGDEEGEATPGSSPKPGKGNNDGAKKDEEEKGDDEEKKGDEEKPAAGDADEKADEDEDEEEGAPTASADEEGEEEGAGEEADDGADPDNIEEAVDTAQGASASWEEINKELKHDFDELASVLITNSAADAASSADYLIFSKEGDKVESLKIGRDYQDDMLTRMEDDVNHMVGPLQKDLERAISARSLASWNPGHRSGRLNAASLSRLAVGDDRVFRRKHEVNSKDVAVSLLVDMSGSMHGSKIDTATKAAYALAQVLERIGIQSEVLCFTTGAPIASHEDLRAEAVKIKRNYSRVESLYMPILKGFNERLNSETKKRFGWLPNVADLRNNVDGECVEIAARRLMARREKGKILIVLSDGAPHCMGNTSELERHLKKVVDNVSRAGVNVVGIGIESSEVKRFYPKSVVINNVRELPTIVMKELRALIVQ